MPGNKADAVPWGRLQKNMLPPIKNKNILLLQGPMGPFFRRLDKAFRRQGARVQRICFNGGDFLFANKDNCRHFTGTPDQWEGFIDRFLQRHRIDMLFLYGDCRFYHRKARDAASRGGIDVYVFEEGYLRPHFITLEKGGVNAHSGMPRSPSGYREAPADLKTANNSQNIRFALEKWSFYAIAYYLAMRLLSWHYPHYRHHRNDSVLKETFFGARNGWRKIVCRFRERGLEKRLRTDLKKRYFFVPLQTIGDTQISIHSPFGEMRDFITAVMRSFAAHAPADTRLVIKHHPLDRGRIDHSGFIRRLGKRLDLDGRVLAVHDVHLPTCLKNAVGTITVNSTVGISSLINDTPTLVLGKAVYDIDGLTCNGMGLDRFWYDYRAPDRKLFECFRSHLIDHTQIVGSFYSGFPEGLRGSK
jgi:capsular polysaccharide export protein